MISESVGFVFPNDYHILWSIMIVLYPYITGLVAGAFIVSSFYHVFDKDEFKPVARFSLAASFSFLLIAPIPLLVHLGHPERAFNVLLTPNFSSAMAGFGILYSFYLIVLLLEIWLVFRVDIIMYARQSRGVKRFFYKSLALWTYDISPEARKFDHKWITFFAAIGIPSACGLHGYVGFLFGALKANVWWSTPLMPIIFLFSAIVSGIAMLIVLYQIFMKIKGMSVDRRCLEGMVRWLWLFMIIAVGLEMLEIITLAYERAEEWEIISLLLTTKLSFSFLAIQVIGGSLIPFVILMILVIMNPYLQDKALNMLSTFASILLLIQVFSMRWNVIIGGQLFSKSLKGFREPYVPEFWGKEGLGVAILIMLASFIILILFEVILPIFQPNHNNHAEATGENLSKPATEKGV
ncbi:MAG: polysulfide reductase NrfD [Myxococcota bacterium]